MSLTIRRTQNHENRIARRFVFFAMATAVVLAAFLSPASLIRSVSAAPDAKDISFGQNGRVVLWPHDSVNRLAIQPDGKILVAQRVFFGQYQLVVLDRYLQSGALEWRETVPGTAAQVAFHELLRLRCLIRPDGKIVVGIATASNSVIALLNSNGSVDASFGSGGTLVTTWMNDIGVLPDNRLVLLNGAGLSIYDASGALVQVVPLPYISVSDPNSYYRRGLAVGKDGRIVTIDSNLMAIFNADLTPDSSFCPNGLCALALPAAKVKIANDGKIILAQDGNKVGRYLSNGSVDTGFGTSGIFDFGTNVSVAVFEVDDAGRVLVGLVSFYAYAYIQVIEADGSSAELLSITPDLPNVLTDIALQENGKLLVSGATAIGDEILGRYHYSDEQGSVANLRFETTRTSPAATVRRGHEITYTITVHNNGPAKAGHVTFENAIPNGTTFVSFEAPEGWVTYQQPHGFVGNKVSCSGYRLESGQSAEFQLTVRVNSNVAQGTQIVNISQVSSLVPDPMIFNNTTFSTLTVQ